MMASKVGELAFNGSGDRARGDIGLALGEGDTNERVKLQPILIEFYHLLA